MSSSTPKARRVAIATTGGDAPGMNACIRSCVLACLQHELTPIGVRRGALGLVRGEPGDFFELLRNDVRNVLERGSTFLGSARAEDYLRFVSAPKPSLDDIARQVIGNFRKNEVDSLILIGGDTTFTAAKAISDATEGAMPIVMVPASIDNDLYGSDLTIGYDTALHETAQYIDRIRETARAFERVFVIETMGNECGLLAAEAALISGAEELIVPELPYDAELFEQMCARVERADRSVLIVVAEGARLPQVVPDQTLRSSPARIIQLALEARLRGRREVRVGTPGYTVRGASPTALSRLMALEAGGRAVDAIRRRRATGENFTLLRFDRSASANAYNASGMTLFAADRTLRVKSLCQQVADQAY